MNLITAPVMTQKAKILEFVSFVIEEYKITNHLTGSETAEFFEQHGVLDFLFNNYEALHTQGKQYILSEVDLFLNERVAK